MSETEAAVATLALVAGLAWGSGLRLYLTLLVVGLVVHFRLAALPPAFDILGHPWVLAAAGVVAAAEFFADKVPGFDSLWDGFHTFVRIPAGVILAGAAVGPADPVWVAVAAILGGAITSGVHVGKTGSRALINTSPEPFSNWAASFGEEAVLLAGLWAMLRYPLAFLLALALFLLLLAWLIPRLYRGLRALVRPRGDARSVS